MPELPEVETVARTLAPQVCGRRIADVNVLNVGTWQGETPPQVVADGGFVITATGRRGKLLLLYLSPHGSVMPAADTERDIPAPSQAAEWPLFYTAEGVKHGHPDTDGAGPDEVTALAFHLRMTGRVFVYPAGTAPEKHTRLIMTLDDGRRLFFDDTRKFGQVRALTFRERQRWDFWRCLGPEPLEITDMEFASRFHSGRAVKALLLDQSVVAGVGNIYADESLFRAGIRPDVPGEKLSAQRLARLHRALVEVLLESVRDCGSSIRDYRTARGNVGAFQNCFCVYGRAGEVCTVCGRKLASGRVAGRATVWCPHCQKR